MKLLYIIIKVSYDWIKLFLETISTGNPHRYVLIIKRNIHEDNFKTNKILLNLSFVYCTISNNNKQNMKFTNLHTY